MRHLLIKIFETLYRANGPMHWWPADTPFEVMVGAILTQNTSWVNVDKAIRQLKDKGALNPERIHKLRQPQLASLIRSSGFYRIKAARLNTFVNYTRTVIGFSRTGGQCRATSYVSLIKKALIAAGFENVPVVTISTSMQGLNDQPGFKYNAKAYMYRALISMAFTDALSDMYYSTVTREKNKGEAKRIADRYLTAFMEGEIPTEKKALLAALQRAVEEFNAIEVDDRYRPRVGIVGEIYVKYNAFSNNNAAEWLIDQGIEVVMPTFLEFFASGVILVEQRVKGNLARHNLLWLLALL